VAAGNVHQRLFVKKRRRQQRRQPDKGHARSETNWMSVLASLAAASRVDGGASLQLLLQRARFDERPHLSLTKRVAA
jgi:hypothetical protein